MGYCTNCGHQLEAGRFCTSCGHPVPTTADVGPEARTDTAERPAAPPPPPRQPPPSTPPPSSPPPPPRFPLFADETEPPAYVASEPDRPGPRPVWPFVLIATALLLVIGVLVAVAVRAGDSGGADDEEAAGKPTRTASGAGGAPGDGLARQSTVEVPASAPPNQDVTGRPTTYVGANMLDGVPETCWRMPGDGSGEEVTVTLPRATHLLRVGLINGYAKTAQDAQGRSLDWYHGNRRVLAVEWVFDDGSTVEQDLADTTAVQSVDVDVTTTTIVLRLVSVSPPSTGPAGRDYTAISDLSLVAP